MSTNSAEAASPCDVPPAMEPTGSAAADQPQESPPADADHERTPAAEPEPGEPLGNELSEGENAGPRAAVLGGPAADVPGERECLRRVAEISEAVAAGLMPPAQGKASLAGYQVLLQHYRQRDAQNAGAGGGVPGLMRLAEAHPELQPLLAEFLVEDELTAALRRATEEDDDEQA